MIPQDVVGITRVKGGKLEKESMTHGVYTKKCGFRTSKPVVWAKALEKILTVRRCDYTLAENRYTHCQVKIPHNGGMLYVDITFTTGLICISGSNYETWAGAIFDPWKSLAISDVFIPIIQPQSSQTAVERTNDIDIVGELENLWEEQKTIRTAFSALESSVNTMNESIQQLTRALDTVTKEQSEMRTSVGKSMDKRITDFLDTMDMQCAENIKTCKEELSHEIREQATKMGKVESRFQSITDNLRNQYAGKGILSNDTVKPTSTSSLPLIDQIQISRIDRNVQAIQD